MATIPLGIVISKVTDGDHVHFYGDFVTLIDGKVRNGSSIYGKPVNGFIEHLKDLRVCSQGDKSSTSLYGFEVEYRNVFSVDINDATHMYHTLRAFGKRMDAMYQTRGYVKSFGEYVGRVAEAMKVKYIMFVRREGNWHDDTEYRYDEVGQGVYAIDAMVAEHFKAQRAEEVSR